MKNAIRNIGKMMNAAGIAAQAARCIRSDAMHVNDAPEDTPVDLARVKIIVEVGESKFFFEVPEDANDDVAEYMSSLAQDIIAIAATANYDEDMIMPSEPEPEFEPDEEDLADLNETDEGEKDE